MRTASFIALSALAALCVTACSTSRPSKPTSAVEGRVTTSTFALGAPTGVDAIDERGTRTHVQLGADGAFRFDIAKGHMYRLVTLTPKGEEPIVFPRTGGRLDRSFRLSSGGALVSLGAVHHFDRAPATFTTTNAAKTSCENGSQGADDNNDGECENGKDAKTGAACNDGDNASDDADPAQAMDVPDNNPPNDVAGCEDGENDGEDSSD